MKTNNNNNRNEPNQTWMNVHKKSFNLNLISPIDGCILIRMNHQPTDRTKRKPDTINTIRFVILNTKYELCVSVWWIPYLSLSLATNKKNSFDTTKLGKIKTKNREQKTTTSNAKCKTIQILYLINTLLVCMCCAHAFVCRWVFSPSIAIEFYLFFFCFVLPSIATYTHSSFGWLSFAGNRCFFAQKYKWKLWRIK